MISGDLNAKYRGGGAARFPWWRWHVCHRSGFSLVELLVAMGVLALIAVMMLSLTSSAQRVAKQTSSRTEQFREARRAFDRINQRLSLATLNTYWDYVDASGNPRPANSTNFTPRRYARVSELRYLQTNAALFSAPRGGRLVGSSVFFQAPLGQFNNTNLSGLNSLLNTVGFFVERGSDTTFRPPTTSSLPAKVRYRLFELIEPSENLTIYGLTSGNAGNTSTAWFTTPLAATSNSHRLADNIVALLFQAQYTDSTGSPLSNFAYSSTPRGQATQSIEENNLPPSVRVTMIAIDEISAARIENQNLTLADAVNDASLEQLEQQLNDNRLNYRKFESSVSIGPSKWSSQ